jgi:hypothetical protein
MTTVAHELVAAGIVMPCREDDAADIIDKHASEYERIIAAIESGEVWCDVRYGMQGAWHRTSRRDFHEHIVDAWREPEWTPQPKPIKLTPLNDDVIDRINADAAGRKIE